MKQRAAKQVAIVLGAGAMLWLTGCGVGTMAPASKAPVVGTAITGRVMGGQQPVAGSTIQVYETGIGGYGTLSTPLGSAVTTTALGNFNLPSFTCDPGRVMYITSTGGQPIAATQTTAAVTNANLALVGLYGICGEGTANFVDINELTTVATVWSLQPFMTDVTHIATSATNQAGIAEAVEVAYEMVDPQTGTVSSSYTPSGATLPTAQINTLADMLEQCVNSGGGAASDTSTNCGKLFNLAPNAAGTTYPTDTITAALNIAKSPGRNVASLNAVRSSSPVFQPATDVNTPPGSWTLAITYTGGGLSSPSAIAVDGSGNVWVANAGNNTVSEFDPTGNTTSTSAGYVSASFSSPSGIAVDQSNNVWVTNAGNGSLVKLNSSGGVTQTTATISGATSVSIDTSGNAVVSNGGQVSTVSSGGTVQNTFSSPGGTVVGVVSTNQ